MRFPRIAAWLFRLFLARIVSARDPDFIIGADNPGGAYLRRWWVIPRNPFFNVYLHHFMRDDDDRALHDHPWVWASFLLSGGYIEHTIAPGGIHHRRQRWAGSLKVSGASRAHRVELMPRWWLADTLDDAFDIEYRMPRAKGECWTLFFTGPRTREWGFHCPDQGWIPWQQFTAPGNKGEVGPGCGQ